MTIDRDTQVILVRFQQKVYAFNLACPHENTALRWKPRDGCFQCPRHESQYRPDGTFITGRATRNMDRFAVKRAGDSVVVDLNRLLRSDQQAQDSARRRGGRLGATLTTRGLRYCLITVPSRRRISPHPPFSRCFSPVSPWPKGYFAAARSSTSMPQPGASFA